MLLGRVTGNIVSTRKCDKLTGYKLLLIESYYGDEKAVYVAADQIGAGIGDLVLITTDYAVRYALDKDAPIDALVVGIVDNDPGIK